MGKLLVNSLSPSSQRKVQRLVDLSIQKINKASISNQTKKEHTGMSWKLPSFNVPKLSMSDVKSFLEEEYGDDITKMLSTVNGIVGAATLFARTKESKDVIANIQKGVGAVLFGIDFYSKIVQHAENKDSDSWAIFSRFLATELGTDKKSRAYEDAPAYDMHKFETDMFKWMVSIPNMKTLKIMKVFTGNYTAWVPYNGKLETGTNEVLFIIKDVEQELLAAVRVIITLFGSMVSVSEVYCHTHEYTKTSGTTWQDKLTTEYIDSLDLSNSIIKFESNTTVTVPRRACPVKVNQFDVDRLVKEISAVLGAKRRRAIVLAGRPGVGKSSVIRSIEDRMRGTMIVHMSPEDFQSTHSIRRCFNVITSYQPLVLVVEDIDSCDVGHKNEIVGAFLDAIDEVNKQLNIFIIVTVNDTSRVHSTLINRPGRFDMVYEVKSPQSNQEVHEVFGSKIANIHINYYPDGEFDTVMSEINLDNMKSVYDMCRMNDLTQAEISEAVIEDAFVTMIIDKVTPSVESFIRCSLSAITKHANTRAIIAKYKGEAMMDFRESLKTCEDTD